MTSELSTPSSASFDALPNFIVATSVLPFVTSTDWLNLRVTNRRCYEIVHGHGVGGTQQQYEEEESEALWRLALVRDYHFEQENNGHGLSMYQSIRSNPDPDDDVNPFLSTSDVFTASTAFISWKHWRKIDRRLHHTRATVARSAQVVGPYFLRAASLWRKIEQWCSDESLSGDLGSIIQSTLVPGVPFDSLVELRSSLGHYQDGKLAAFKAVYSFYAGQNCGADFYDTHGLVLPGLFGGYHAYNYMSHSTWLPPEVLEGSFIIVAKDVNEVKLTVVDAESGDVAHLIRPHGANGAGSVIKAVRGGNNDDQILRWFENHANQLEQYSVGKLTPDGFESILRYPSVNDPFNCSRAITRGVEVVASSLYSIVLEVFVYSIRIRLLRPEDGEGYMTPEERGFETCQLVSRYWRIDQGGEVEEIRGEGVIGYYPLLREGGYQNFVSNDGGHTFRKVGGEGNREEYFSYQSCTNGEEGSMEGQLQFKAGSIRAGDGEVFNVRVAPFPLNFSQYYY